MTVFPLVQTVEQVRLNGVATLIGIVGLSVAGVVLVVLWIRWFSGTFVHCYGAL